METVSDMRMNVIMSDEEKVTKLKNQYIAAGVLNDQQLVILLHNEEFAFDVHDEDEWRFIPRVEQVAPAEQPQSLEGHSHMGIPLEYFLRDSGMKQFMLKSLARRQKSELLQYQLDREQKRMHANEKHNVEIEEIKENGKLQRRLKEDGAKRKLDTAVMVPEKRPKSKHMDLLLAIRANRPASLQARTQEEDRDRIWHMAVSGQVLLFHGLKIIDRHNKQLGFRSDLTTEEREDLIQSLSAKVWSEDGQPQPSSDVPSLHDRIRSAHTINSSGMQRNFTARVLDCMAPADDAQVLLNCQRIRDWVQQQPEPYRSSRFCILDGSTTPYVLTTLWDHDPIYAQLSAWLGGGAKPTYPAHFLGPRLPELEDLAAVTIDMKVCPCPLCLLAFFICHSG